MYPAPMDPNVPKNRTGKPRKPPKDVEEKQDPRYSTGDFDRDLEKATRRVEEPSAPGRGSSRR
jgi:hypothetical protein